MSCDVELTFAMAGLEDHAVSREGDDRVRLLVDIGHTVSSATGDTREERSDALARLIAGEAFRAAWDRYRAAAPGWQKTTNLGVLEPLARAVAVAAPVAVYAFDRNFFPLARWLHDPMLRGIDALNHEATLLLDPRTDLSQRAEVLASLRRPGLRGDPALGVPGRRRVPAPGAAGAAPRPGGGAGGRVRGVRARFGQGKQPSPALRRTPEARGGELTP
jgi:hypothetical protein